MTAGLDAASIAWERAPRLVRGLDYYRHTAFEFITDRLGAQGTVLAGGRYDGLIELLGGPYHASGWLGGGYRTARDDDRRARSWERPKLLWSSRTTTGSRRPGDPGASFGVECCQPTYYASGKSEGRVYEKARCKAAPAWIISVDDSRRRAERRFNRSCDLEQ